MFVRGFPGLDVRGYQTIILFVRDVGMFLQVLCILFIRGLYGLHVGDFLLVLCILSENFMV